MVKHHLVWPKSELQYAQRAMMSTASFFGGLDFGALQHEPSAE